MLTGLLYLAPDAEDLHAHLNTYEAAFNTLGEKELCPGAGMLEKINAGLRVTEPKKYGVANTSYAASILKRLAP